MAGIRVRTPIGPSWRYSLNGITWQDSPVFLVDANGNALIPGVTYTVYMRSPRFNRVIIERITLGSTRQLGFWVVPTTAEADALIPAFSQTAIDALQGRMDIPDQNYIAPDEVELLELRQRLGIPVLDYVAPNEAELKALRDRLDIPEAATPVYVAPEKTQIDQLLDLLNQRRRGGLLSIPLLDSDALLLAWQIAPIIGFDPIVARPVNYHELVDDLTARSIARQIVFGEWGFEFDLLDLPTRIVLEQAEVMVLSAQLAPLFDFHKYVPPTLLEQFNELPEDVLEKIRLRINKKAPTFMEEFRATTATDRLEIREIIPCCEDEGTGPVTPAMNLVVTGNYEPIGTAPANRAPVVNNPMTDKHLLAADSRVFYLPADQFTDPDGDQLTLTAKQTTGTDLPTEIIFTAAQRKFEVTDGYETATAIRVTATDPGGLSVGQSFLLSFEGAAVNQPPVLIDPMPDITITTADQQTFALPDAQFSDPEGATLVTTVSSPDGSALPAWLSYNPSTRTFTKAAGFTTGQTNVLTTATDPGGLTATDTFSVVVNAPTAPATEVAEVRKKVITGTSTRWILYIKTSPLTSAQDGGTLFVRVRTINGGYYDSGFTAWEAAQNNQGSQGDYYSQPEAEAGFAYLVQKNTFSGEDNDASHVVYVQLSITPDGANAKEYTFTVTENQAQSTVIIYPLV
jgi:hypothetical protein